MAQRSARAFPDHGSSARAPEPHDHCSWCCALPIYEICHDHDDCVTHPSEYLCRFWIRSTQVRSLADRPNHGGLHANDDIAFSASKDAAAATWYGLLT